MSYTQKERASIVLQVAIKSVVNNYPQKEFWTEAEHVEIMKRVGMVVNIYQHHYKEILKKMKGNGNDQSQN